MIPMNWQKGTFAQKLLAVEDAIERAGDKHVVLIGESAGGSMALHAYARHPRAVKRVVTLCGKNSHPETVGERYLQYSPAFKGSMDHLNESLSQLTARQMASVVSIHPLYDHIVPVRETLLPKCRRIRVPLVGHMAVIILLITLLSPIIVREITRD